MKKLMVVAVLVALAWGVSRSGWFWVWGQDNAHEQRPPQANVEQNAASESDGKPFDDRTTVPRGVLGRIKEATVFIVSRYVRLEDLGRNDLDEDDFVDATGSGFLLSSGGLILTNAHVVAPFFTHEGEPEDRSQRSRWAARIPLALHSVVVWRNSGRRNAKKYDAKVVCTRPRPLDIALVRIEPDEPLPEPPDMDPVQRLDIRREALETQRVWSVGFPLGRHTEDALSAFGMSRNPNGPDISIREGSISALRHNEHGRLKAIEHTCPIEPGNSGGPLVNVHGDIMGINSFGVGKKGHYAIPLDVILNEFIIALQLERYRALFGDPQVPRRTLHVDPQASDPDETTFRTIREAIADAHRGDTIRLAAGEYVLSETLAVPAGFRLVGAGIDRTILKQDSDKRFSPVVLVGGPDGFEVSDLTVHATGQGDTGEAATALGVVSNARHGTYLHDLRLRSNFGWGLKVGGCADIVNCRIETGAEWRTEPAWFLHGSHAAKVLRGGPVRIERVRCQGHLALVDSGAHVEGCSGTGIYLSGEQNSATVQGCRFEGLIVTDGARPTIRDSFFKDQRFRYRYCIVMDAARAVFRGNHLQWYRAMDVTGSGTRAELTGNFFQDMELALNVSKGASAKMRDNIITFSSGAHLSSALPLGKKWDECFGIEASGSRTTVSYSGNLFRSTYDGHAVEENEGGSLQDEGGNIVRIR